MYAYFTLLYRYTIRCNDIIIVQERVWRLAYRYSLKSVWEVYAAIVDTERFHNGNIYNIMIFLLLQYYYTLCRTIVRACINVYMLPCKYTCVLLYDPFSSADVFYGGCSFSRFSATIAVEQRWNWPACVSQLRCFLREKYVPAQVLIML